MGYRYLYSVVVLDISVVNSHATSAYECELLERTTGQCSIRDSAVKKAPMLPAPFSL